LCNFVAKISGYSPYMTKALQKREDGKKKEAGKMGS
jgi:hypothetical protein